MSTPYDKRTTFERAQAVLPDAISQFLASGDEALTATEAALVQYICEGKSSAEALRLALPPDVVTRLDEGAIRMGATHATRRTRVLRAISFETQRKVILAAPKMLAVQLYLAQHGKTESVRQRAARTVMAWNGLGNQGGDERRSAPTPTVKIDI